MQQLPLEQKVDMVLPYLAAGRLGRRRRSPESLRPKVAPDRRGGRRPDQDGRRRLDYTDFFVADDQLPYDEKAFDKALRKPGAAELLAKFRDAPGRGRAVRRGALGSD